MLNEKISISPAVAADFTDMIDVLKHYHFRLLPIGQAETIDPSEDGTLTVYNEVSHFDFAHAFVARVDGQIAGCCHWRLNNPTEAKTTLISVDPIYREQGIGLALQIARMKAAYEAGAKYLLTFCDTDKSTRWYIKHFGYEISGEEPDHHRLHYFDVDGKIVWGIHFGFPGHVNGTKLVCDLERFFISSDLASGT
ncbi:MAG: GNAT family N-acetyltransferase [Patescibacteria group bacterium]